MSLASLFVLLSAVAFLAAFAREANAQVTVSPRTSPALGTTIRGTTATTFSISTTGTATRVSGDAIRLARTPVDAPAVSFSCGLLNLGGLCALRPLRVTIAPIASDTAMITRFRVSNLTGATYRNGSAPAEAQLLVFELNPLGLLSTGSFHLGMDVVLSGGSPSRSHPVSYTVTVQLLQTSLHRSIANRLSPNYDR